MFQAFIGINKVFINLGLFSSLVDAIKARQEGERSYWRGTNKDPHWRAFYTQRLGAKKRGILFKLTFEEWLKIWEESGHLHERGQAFDQYCMCRHGDSGAYELGNVSIKLTGDNTREAHFGRRYPPDVRKKMGAKNVGRKLTKIHRLRISLGLVRAHQEFRK